MTVRAIFRISPYQLIGSLRRLSLIVKRAVRNGEFQFSELPGLAGSHRPQSLLLSARLCETMCGRVIARRRGSSISPQRSAPCTATALEGAVLIEWRAQVYWDTRGVAEKIADAMRRAQERASSPGSGGAVA